MTEDPAKRLEWLRGDVNTVRSLVECMPEDWYQERMEMAHRIEEHEREIAALTARCDRSPRGGRECITHLQERWDRTTSYTRAAWESHHRLAVGGPDGLQARPLRVVVMRERAWTRARARRRDCPGLAGWYCNTPRFSWRAP